ncbi:MAG: hypothetical protein K2N25_01335 [Muribaculaceae bacterium]|nr:hypothetical protein [Muribaculaceae bacterium]
MDFEKNSESVFRYKENGETKERVDLLQYNLKDGGEEKGNVIVYATQAQIQITISGFSSIEESEAKAREVIAAIDEVTGSWKQE